MRRPEDEPPAGWVTVGNVLQPGGTVLDYASRGQRVRGVCDGVSGCKRTVTLDPRELCKDGLARLSMDRIRNTYRCNRLDACILAFHDLPPDLELTLNSLTGKPHVRVRLRCRGCNLVRTFLAEDVVAKLRKSGKGGFETRLRDLSKVISGRCPATTCGKSNWTVDVLWLRTDSQGWRRTGEKMFEGMT